MELEIGTTIPVHQVEVRLKPQIPTETSIPNADGSPPTPSPPASPRPDSDSDDEDQQITHSIMSQPQNITNIIAQVTSTDILIPHTINSLSHPDPHDTHNTLKVQKYDMQKEQDKDKYIRQVKSWIRQQIILETKYEPQEIQQYAKQLTRLHLTEEGLLVRYFYHHDGNSYDTQLVIPQHLREEIMQLLHNAKTASHRGSRKTIEQCRRS